MPLTAKGQKILAAMKKEYGPEKGERVFYASINKGKIKGAEPKKKHGIGHAIGRYLEGR
jgi:hypothetical protein